VIQSVDRALKLLWLVRDNPGTTLTELSKQSDLLPSTALRLLTTLELHSLVSRAPGTKSYRLGPATRSLSSAGSDRVGLALRVEPAVRRLASRTEERASFAVLDGGLAVHLVNVDGAAEAGSDVIYAGPADGRSDNLNASGVGKIILAYSPADVSEALIRHLPFTRTGQRTICSDGELRLELTHVSRRGYATSIDETSDHIRGVAAPVFDAGRSLIGAMSVHGPAYRFSRADIRKFVPMVIAAAREASALFGDHTERPSSVG
jgi:DNA-binding IclR family transcriptional regulator